MQVTFLAINYAPSVGGSQELVRRVAEGLVARHDHRVTVVTTDALHAPGGPDPGHVEPAREVIDGVEVLRFPVAHGAQSLLRAGRRLGSRLGRVNEPAAIAYGPLGARLALGARRRVRASDVVVAVSAPFTTIPLAERFARGTDTAFVAVPLLHLGDWQPSAQVVSPLRRADRCVTQTDYEADWLVARDLERERIDVIPPGCDVADHPERSSVEARVALGVADRPTVAFIGRLAAHKGIDTVLSAFAELAARDPEPILLLAGQRTTWDLDAALACLPDGIVGRVVVRENFSQADKPTMFAAADVVVFPSREESFGIVTLESWAARRPVVVADVGAIGSVVRTGVDGVVVPVDDVGALAGAVTGLLADPVRRAAYGRAGRERVEAECPWDRIIDRWDGVLRDAVAARRSDRTPAVRN